MIVDPITMRIKILGGMEDQTEMGQDVALGATMLATGVNTRNEAGNLA